jgi:PAS domain S-box-containing protein
MSDVGGHGRITLPEAAGLLHLPVESIEALVGAGYLRTTASPDGWPRLALGDLKAFLARNSEGERVVDLSDLSLDEVDPQSLLDALDGRSEDMARRALDLLVAVFPEAGRWSLTQQAHFVEEAQARFEAIVAVAALGNDVDDSLIDELAMVGVEAAWANTPLQELLLVLRISRDLVVQTAVEVAEERGRHWGLALSLLLTRVLPAMDRLTDAIARGYWQSVMERQEESRARYANVVEHSSDGVYEVGLDGRVRYANTALAVILGRSVEQLVGARLVDALDPETNFRLDAEQTEVAIRRADGVVRVLDIRAVERRDGEELIGFDGIVRDLTAAVRFEELRNDLLALLGHELRQPLTTILGLGAVLDSHSEELDPAQVQSIGERIRQQAERMTRQADDLDQMSLLDYDSLLVNRRRLDVRTTVHAALASVAGADIVDVRIPSGVHALADRRRLEQVVANLVENALKYGASPVVVTGERVDAEIVVRVTDRGPGVQEAETALFSRLRLTGMPRRRQDGTGLGLALVRGLVEAMGGRVWYESAPEGGARFSFTLPSA